MLQERPSLLYFVAFVATVAGLVLYHAHGEPARPPPPHHAGPDPPESPGAAPDPPDSDADTAAFLAPGAHAAARG